MKSWFPVLVGLIGVAIGMGSGQLDPELHYNQMIDSYNRNVSTDGATPCTGLLNDFALECDRAEGGQLDNIDGWDALALVNRIDLAPDNGRHCGQQRIILANRTPRMFVIFEAQIENPRPQSGLDGCRPVANFWARMSTIDSPEKRRDELLDAFLNGRAQELDDAGFGPFISANFLGPQGGQLRTNNFIDGSWTLREFRIRRRGSEMVIAPEPVTDSPHGILWNDRDPLSDVTVGPQCRESFLRAISGLLTDNTARMSLMVDAPACWNAESRSDFESEDYRMHLENGIGAFRDQINDMIQGSGLTPENIADRARFAGSCIGCHEEATGLDLGRGVESPFTLGFVHVTEERKEDCEDDPSENCFAISPALKEVFLPHRKTVMKGFLSGSTSSAAVTQERRPLLDNQKLNALSLATRDFKPSQERHLPRTLGGQPMGTNH